MIIVIWINRRAKYVGLETLEGWEADTHKEDREELWYRTVHTPQQLKSVIDDTCRVTSMAGFEFESEKWSEEMVKYLK